MSKALTAIVIDDEALARKRMERLLTELGLTVLDLCESAEAARIAIDEHDVDVMFVDIDMPKETGLELLASLGEAAPAAVLCTAHRNFALDAFEHGAVDYVVKPVQADRLSRAIDRVRARLAPAPIAKNVARSAEPLARLAIPTHKGVVLLSPQSISHLVLEAELVKIVGRDGAFLCDEPLATLGERLPEDTFLRVHRRAIVNLDAVARLEPLETGGYTAHMRDGATVEVSRQAARDLRRRLGL